MAGTPRYHKDLRVINVLESKYDCSTDATGKLIGTLPKGAVVLLSSSLTVSTVFSGGSATVDVGFAADTNAIFATADITEGTTGIYPAVAATLKTGGFTAPLGADTDVIWTVNEDSGTGVARAFIAYYVPFSEYGNITA